MTASRRAFAPIAALLVLLAIAAAPAIACSGDKGDDTPAIPEPSEAGHTEDGHTEETGPTATSGPTPVRLSLSSSAFGQNETIPPVYTCDGGDAGNISPPLSISHVPALAESLVLIMHDPDAPVSGGFTHWTVWDIDPSTTEVAEDTVPAGGIEGQTSRGSSGYFGPCPPSGTHHYEFTLYALDDTLDLDPESAGKAEIEAAIVGHVVESAELVGTYGR